MLGRVSSSHMPPSPENKVEEQSWAAIHDASTGAFAFRRSLFNFVLGGEGQWEEDNHVNFVLGGRGPGSQKPYVFVEDVGRRLQNPYVFVEDVWKTLRRRCVFVEDVNLIKKN